MAFKQYILREDLGEYGNCKECGKMQDCEDRICVAGSPKCFCRKRKVTPGKLDVTNTLDAGSFMAMKGV